MEVLAAALFIVVACAGIGLARAASSRRARRSTGHARPPVRSGGGALWLPLQELIEPRVEHVLVAQSEPRSELGQSDGEDDELTEDTLAAALRDCLAQAPISHEEIRRCLREAGRAGLDWRELYEAAVRRVLATQPYRAPQLPPIDRVAPR